MMSFRNLAPVMGMSLSILVCGQGIAIATAAEAPPRKPPIVIAAVGDSVTAGFANATLVEETQRLSYPALIAKQMDVPFGQPYITGDGLPFLGFHFNRKERLLEMPFAPKQPAERLNPSNEGVHNFAVPNAKLWEILTLQEKPGNPLDRLFEVILQGERTQVQQARAKQPDLIIVWAGNNDVLQVCAKPPDDKDRALDKLESRLTPLEDFRVAYRELITRLSAEYEAGPKKGRKPDLIVANIPDINDLPVFMPLGKKLGQTSKVPFKIKVEKNSFVFRLSGFPKNTDKLLTTENLENLELSLTKLGRKDEHPRGSKVSLIAVIDPHLNGRNALFESLAAGKRCFTEAQVLDPGQLQRISNRITNYNRVIKATCGPRGIPVVDIHKLFKDVDNDGLSVGKNAKLTTSYTGGLFSLDAIHPTHTANALIANEFIKVINAEIATRKSFAGRKERIPELDVAKVLEADPQKPRR